MANLTPSPCALWILILTTALTLTGCVGANSKTNTTDTYTVASILVEPFLMKREAVHPGTDAEYEGFIPDLMNELGNLIGANFKITLQPDGKFGSKQDDGSFDGLMGSLIRNDIDVAAAPLTITAARNRVINFSKRFLSTGLVMVISSSTDNMSRVGLIFKPFTPVAWGMLIVALVMIVVFAVIVHRLNPRGEKTGHMASVSTQLTTCSSGGAYSGCVLRTTMALFVVLTVVLYTAGMVNIRPARMDHGQRPQKSNYEHAYIHDIVNSGQYKVAVIPGGATDYFIKMSTVPMYVKMSQTLTYVENISAGFDLILKDPGYAFVTDKALVEYYVSRKPYCGLHIVGGSLNTNGYGLGLPLGSKLREATDMAMLQMQESGVLDMLYHKWWYSRAQCDKKPTVQGKKRFAPSSPGIGSTTLGGVLIILVIGLLLAVGVAIVERFLRTRSSKGNDETKA